MGPDNPAHGNGCCRGAGSTCSTRHPMDIEIEDIAHGLAFVARWNGQTRGDLAYSVAEHSLLVEEMFARRAPGAGRAGGWRRCCMTRRNM
jgi:5'-deoxynucleotidase YfbR-like HD superfamily hydrolase